MVMTRQIEEGDTKGGIIIPKDKFEEMEKHLRKESTP
jgi:co-chaperonin GroES (HSP10)